MLNSRPPLIGLRSILNAKRFDIENFRLYVFQPQEGFYFLPFQKRLNLLEKSIAQADAWFKDAKLPSTAKALFVAPEYLFKDFSKEGTDCYYSQNEKKLFVQTMTTLSKTTNLVIIPGTICWNKLGNKAKQPQRFFRNTAYFFHQGECEKYKKNHPALSDADHNKGGLVEKNIFITGQNDSSIKRINGLTIGIEICLDNTFDVVINGCKKEKINYSSINIHLVLASLLGETHKPTCSGPLFVKIDQRPGYSAASKKFSNSIGKLHSTFVDASCITEQNNLFCYTVTQPSPLATNKNKLTNKFELPYHLYLNQLKAQSLSNGIEKFSSDFIHKLFFNFSLASQDESMFEADFPDYIAALNDACLLTEKNASTLFSMPLYACEYTSSLIELNNAGLLTSEINDLLNKNITKAIILKNLFFKLYNSAYLTSDMLHLFATTAKNIDSLPRSTLREIYALFSELIALGFFKTAYLFDIFRGMPQFHELFSALKAIIMLSENNLLNEHRARVLLFNKKHEQNENYVITLRHLNEISKTFPTLPVGLIEQAIERNFSLLKSINNLLGLIYFNFSNLNKHEDLFKHIKDMSILIDMINELAELNFFTNNKLNNFVGLVTFYKSNAENIFHLALDLIELLKHYSKVHQPSSLFTTAHNAITTPSFVIQHRACAKLLNYIFRISTEDFSNDEKIALNTLALGKIAKRHANTIKLLKIDLNIHQNRIERRHST